MSFLKFLKRDKSNEPDLGMENVEDLDMPPPLPGAGEKDFGGVEKGLPELPDMDTPPPPSDLGELGLNDSIKDELPELPEFPEMPEAEKPLPELNIPSEKPSPKLKLPSMPELPKIEGDLEEPELPQPRRPLFGAQTPRPVASEQKLSPPPEMGVPPPQRVPETRPYERMERAAVREERAVLKHKDVKEPIFIRVDRFRDILTGTDNMRDNLRTAGQSIVKLNDIDANRDKVLEKWNNVMIDMQKKLIFIDKTLFKR